MTGSFNPTRIQLGLFFFFIIFFFLDRLTNPHQLLQLKSIQLGGLFYRIGLHWIEFQSVSLKGTNASIKIAQSIIDSRDNQPCYHALIISSD